MSRYIVGEFTNKVTVNGSIDTSFDIGTGANSVVCTTSIQSDGKIIIGGVFNSYNGTAALRIARLHTNGSIDTSFDTTTGANDTVYTASIQSDGKIIIGGFFTSYKGTTSNYIARLHTNGSLDTGFAVGTGANGSVSTTSIQSDGKIIIGGSLTAYKGTTSNRIARLHTNGDLDTSFVVGSGADNIVITTSIQSDGKIIIGGAFTSYNGTTANRIARLHTNGSIDTSFDSITGANGTVLTTAIQSDGKIIIGGNFFSYNGTTRNYIARLHTNGSLDTSFDIGTGADNFLYTASIQSDGKIIIGGSFTSYNGTTANRVARLHTNGSLDTSFDTTTGADNTIRTTSIQSDGKIIIGGFLASYNGTTSNRIARIGNLQSLGRIAKLYSTDFSIDSSFDPGTGFNNNVVSIASSSSDGNLLAVGEFTQVDGRDSFFTASLTPDGTDNVLFLPSSNSLTQGNVYTIGKKSKTI